jgi:hypothetical protein
METRFSNLFEHGPGTPKTMLVFHRLFIHNKPVMGWWIESFRIMGDGVRLNGSGV